MTKRTATPMVRLNHHLELNGKPSPINNNPSLGLVPGLGFDPGKRLRKTEKQDIEDIDNEESADECDLTGDCEI